MKKVSRDDLLRVIHELYAYYIIDYCESKFELVEIKVDGIYIAIIDTNNFDSEEEQILHLKEFAKQLEAISFGNLKVTLMKCSKKECQSCHTAMFIANAYEIKN